MLTSNFGCVEQLVTDQNGVDIHLQADGWAIRQGGDRVGLYRYRLATPKMSGKRTYVAYRHSRKSLEIMRDLSWFGLPYSTSEIAWNFWHNREIMPADAGGAEALRHIPDGSIPLGLGKKRLAWLTPNHEVAVIGPEQTRPDCPLVLQPRRHQQFGSYSLDWYEFAETRQIVQADVDTIVRLSEGCGWLFFDKHFGNVGRLASGRLVLLDPDAISRIENAPVSQPTSVALPTD